MAQFLPNATSTSRSVMAAVVFGTAISSLQELSAAPSAPLPQSKAVDDISKYCQACWRNARLPADHWQDCTQQVFVRLLERVPQESWAHVLNDIDTQERKEFVRAIDTVKKRTQRTKTFADYTNDVKDETISNAVAEQRMAVEEVAPKVLSHRQQKIVELSFSGWAVPEIAAELGTTVQRISDEKYKAVQKLKSQLTPFSTLE